MDGVTVADVDWDAILGPDGPSFPTPQVTDVERGYAAAVFDLKGSVHAYESRGHLTTFLRVSSKQKAVVERIGRMAGSQPRLVSGGVWQLHVSGRIGERFAFVILPHVEARRAELEAWMELRREVRYRGSEKLLPGDQERRHALMEKIRAAQAARKGS